MRLTEQRNETLKISRRDRKQDKKKIQVPENKEIANSYVLLGTIWNQYQIDVVNTYVCNVKVYKNEDHEPSIEKCTQINDWPSQKETIDKIQTLVKETSIWTSSPYTRKCKTSGK